MLNTRERKVNDSQFKHKLLLVISLILLSAQVLIAKEENNQVKSTLFTEAHNAMIPNKYTNIDSLLVYQKGELVSRNYYGRFTDKTTHRTHSTFKSITVLITLIAIDQGLLTAEELVMPLLNRFESHKNKDPRKNRIRVKNLLNMTSGISCDEAPGAEGPNHEFGVDEGANPLQYSINIGMVTEPGKEWHYCNANSFMLSVSVSAALDRAGREDIFKFAHKYLMEPLGINSYRFTHSQNGKFLNGQGNAYFLPEDLAKFGLLVLNKGKWQGSKIISEELINHIYNSINTINWSFIDLVKDQPNTKTTYAYQWYTTSFEFNGNKISALHSWGNGGQYIFVVPDLKSVVVFTGSNQGNFHKQKQPFDIMHKYVLPQLLKDI